MGLEEGLEPTSADYKSAAKPSQLFQQVVGAQGLEPQMVD